MIYYSYSLDKLVQNLEFVPYRLKRNDVYEVGETYWNSYWQQYYKVLELNGSKVTVQWQNGCVTTHMTSLDTRCDYKLRPFESFCSCDMSKDDFKAFYLVVDNKQSLTAAEIKALCCAGVIEPITAVDLECEYFAKRDYKPNDYVYYYVCKKCSYGLEAHKLIRDLDKSPRPAQGK